MYDRAPRTLTRPSSSTIPGVGPGTYNHHERQSMKVGYAPFLSMAVRESFLTVGEQLAAAPGPGHYSHHTAFRPTKGGGILHNKAERFTPPSSTTPGPGTYVISRPSDWLRKTYPPPEREHSTDKNHFAKSARVRFYREGTAPSIPVPGQSYGYEEDEDGVLKPQKLPPRDSTMGPAYYNVAHGDTAATKKYKGVHFGNLKSLRTQFKGKDGPGPGDYDPRLESGRNSPSKTHYYQGRSEPAANKLNLPRYHELVSRMELKKAVPGPGQYEVRSQFDYQPQHFTTSTTGEGEDGEMGEEMTDGTKAPFGSTQQRFLMPKHVSPAPTTYQDPRTAFESVRKMTGMKRTPFGQTSARFRTNRQAKELPGPGAYNNSEVTSLASELTKKAPMQGIHKCPFGTTSVRTAPLVKRDELYMPGPAHYHQQSQPQGEQGGGEEGKGANSKPQRLSHTFASTSKRLYSPPSIVTDIPPPGSYEVSQSYNKLQGKAEWKKGASSFLSTSDRFAPPRDILHEEPDIDNPGPGQYDSSSPLGKGKQGLLCYREQRFKPIKNSVPGPGAYKLTKCQQDTLLQGTYNITLSNPLGENQAQLETATKKQTFVLGV